MTASKNSSSSSSSWEGKLPENPSLENLKKQAKSVLKTFRKGDDTVCEVLKHLPKFQGSSPSEILDGELCLRESQHALALNYGFKSWKEMQEHVESPKAPETVGKLMEIISFAFKKSASDIHFEWGEGRLHVRNRIDGILRESDIKISEEEQFLIIDNIKIMANLKTEIKNRPQQGMANIKIEGYSLNLRISVIPYVTGESIVIRIWDGSSFLLGFDKLGFSEKQEKSIRKWIDMPNGIIIFSGPFGSGKSTSMYGVIAEMDTDQRKILTAEDPVYLLLKGVNQLQIDPSTGMTYERAIREQMNQDPDVMMVGECRDKEVLDLICQVSLTGHLVFTQMHSNNGPHTLGQLLHMEADSYTLSRTLIGILSQRLVRKICPDCKEEYQPKEWEREGLGIDKKAKLYKGKGCDKCHGTGYRGRTAVYELLEINDDIRSAIVKDVPVEEMAEIAVKQGMTPLKKAGMEKALQGLTTIDEVIRVCG